MRFAAHATYFLREGWVAKGLAAVAEASAKGTPTHVFLDSDAPLRFGLGPAMLQALRFWLRATGLVREDHTSSGGRSAVLTPLGQMIWATDPWCERRGTLWLLHCHLVRNRALATSWYWFFNHFLSATSFDEETCLSSLVYWVIKELPTKAISKQTLKKDLDCLLRMYVPVQQNLTPEQTALCPLARLHLLREQATRPGTARLYNAPAGDPDRVAALIVLFVLLSQQHVQRAGSRQVTITEVLYEPGNVGRLLRLTRSRLFEVFARLRRSADPWQVELLRHEQQEWQLLPSCSPEQILTRWSAEGDRL